MKYAIPILFFFLGVVVFYNYADWGYYVCKNGNPVYVNKTWDFIYFIWDKTKDVLLLGTIFYLLKVVSGKSNKLKQVITISKSILLFALIRLVWEIISLVTGMDINKKEAINIIFIIFLLVWVYPALKILWQWLKRNS